MTGKAKAMTLPPLTVIADQKPPIEMPKTASAIK